MPTTLPTRKPARSPGAAIVEAAVSAGLALLLNAWLIMLLAGVDHDHITAAVPAWSFFQSALVAVTLQVVGSFFYRSGK